MLNKVILQGRLVREPELRRTMGGAAVMDFTLASERDFTRDGKRGSDFIDCTAWTGTAEFIYRNFRKGDMMLTEGSLTVSKWEDDDGNKRKTVRVLVDGVSFCGGRKKEKEEITDAAENDPELPF